jgi:hypothetical protein
MEELSGIGNESCVVLHSPLYTGLEIYRWLICTVTVTVIVLPSFILGQCSVYCTSKQSKELRIFFQDGGVLVLIGPRSIVARWGPFYGKVYRS